ncbi:MAG: T9SS type A sorting domain-containing protein [Bacteroidetes bacterium]|nr:T9SS type A sorting domain-containing protein [Bacteroidota bacterium]
MKPLCTLVFMLFQYISYGQSYSLGAAASGGNEDVYAFKRMADGKDGSFYVIGIFKDSVHFSGSTLYARNSYGVYLAKFNYNVSLLWLKSIAENENTVNSDTPLLTLKTDNDGNLVTGINYTDNLYLFGDSLKLAGQEGVALFKLDSSGAKIWGNSIPGKDIGKKGIAVDPQNNILITGRDSTGVYITKFDSNGNHLWTQTSGGNGVSNRGLHIESDTQGNVFVAGTLKPTSSISFDTIPFVFPSPCNSLAFIVKYSPNGNAFWVRYVYSPTFGEFTNINTMGCLAEGKIVIGGSYNSDMLRFSNGFSSIGPNDPFFYGSYLACFDSTGNRLWAKKLHDNITGNDIVDDVKIVDSTIVMIGDFTNEIVSGSDTLESLGYNDILIENYDSNGDILSQQIIGGTAIDLEHDLFINSSGTFLVGTTTSHPFNVGTDFFDPDYTRSAFVLGLNSIPTAIAESRTSEKLIVYPNPNAGSFSLQSTQMITQIEVSDIMGRIVYSKITDGMESSVSISLPDQRSGLYFLTIIGNDFKITKRITVINN